MKPHKIFSAMGYVIGVAGVLLAWIWFGWKLALIIFLVSWARNLSRLAIFERTKHEVKSRLENSKTID